MPVITIKGESVSSWYTWRSALSAVIHTQTSKRDVAEGDLSHQTTCGYFQQSTPISPGLWVVSAVPNIGGLWLAYHQQLWRFPSCLESELRSAAEKFPPQDPAHLWKNTSNLSHPNVINPESYTITKVTKKNGSFFLTDPKRQVYRFIIIWCIFLYYW